MVSSMSRMDVVQGIVIETLQEVSGPEAVVITPETDLGDLGFDSLGLTAVVARIESEFAVQFETHHILEMYQSMLVSDLAQAIADGVEHCLAHGQSEAV